MMTGIVAIEFLDIRENESSMLIAELNAAQGKDAADSVTCKSNFQKSLLDLAPDDIKDSFKSAKIKGRKLLLILPDDCCRSMIWEADDIVRNKELTKHVKSLIAENNADSETLQNTDIRWSFSGSADGSKYGIASSVDCNVLDNLYRIFKGFDIKYVIPKLTAYSLAYGQYGGHTGVIDIQKDRLAVLMYGNGVLIWTHTESIADTTSDSSLCEMITQALYIAGSKRIYPTNVHLTGDSPEMESIRDMLFSEFNIPCQVQSPDKAEFFTMIKTAKIAFDSKKMKDQRKPINYRPLHTVINRRLRPVTACIYLLLLLHLGVAAYNYVSIMPLLTEMRNEQNAPELLALQRELSDVLKEKAADTKLMEYLIAAGEGGVQLNNILTVSEQYQWGINILAITDDRITGTGLSLDLVTQYIRELSEQLGKEIDVENILQIQFPDSGPVIGFEVRL